jgi:hypothetical protein
LGFNQAMNFTNAPNRGLLFDSSLVGYWNMAEGSGMMLHDSTGNGNNATMVNLPIWTTGIYGNAVNFNGSNYAKVNNSPSINISGALTVSVWIKANNINKYGQLIDKEGSDVYSGVYSIRIDQNNTLTVRLSQGGSILSVTTGQQINSTNTWYNLVFTYDGVSHLAIYVNGVSASYYGNKFSGPLDISSKPLLIGQRESGDLSFDGIIDDVRIYNRSLSANEVANLYTQPDPESLANYYSYQDSNTNNTMTIYVNNPNGGLNNSTLVTCLDFFADNALTFQANDSAIINVWTNLGKPVFTTGAWNNNNFTTTLALDAFSTAELNWITDNITTYVDAHSSVSPSNVTVLYGADQTFSFNASQGYSFNVAVDGVSQGQISSYTFSNVTAPHSVNVTSALLKYTISATADSGSTISPSGDVSVNYGGSQLFTVQNKTGYNVTHVYVDNVDKGAISNYTFSNVTANHVISVSSESLSSANSSTPTPTPSPSASPTPTATPTPTSVPSQSPEPTNSSSPTQTSQPENNQFPTQTTAIAAAAIAILVAVFALAFKKGYITIEVVEEEKPQEASDDYTI